MTYEEIKIIENYIAAAAIPQSARRNITENFFTYQNFKSTHAKFLVT